MPNTDNKTLTVREMDAENDRIDLDNLRTLAYVVEQWVTNPNYEDEAYHYRRIFAMVLHEAGYLDTAERDKILGRLR